MDMNRWYQLLFSILCVYIFVPVHSQEYKQTGLPVCYITTDDHQEIVSKREYIVARMTLVDDNDTLLLNVEMNIRGRGNATWHTYPKKPYKLKFNKNVNILSNYGKHFALLPNYCDKSLMRTAIGFETCRLLEMDWVPADDFVELVLNGKHLGTYQLAETIRANKRRIQVEETGFLLQYDRFWYADDANYFFTHIYNYPMIVKSPDEDEITDNIFYNIKKTMNAFESALVNNSYLWDIIDIESFSKWYYASNILMLIDPNYYFYKKDNTEESLINMGPLWDFEWSLGIGWYDGIERPNPNHTLVDSCYFQQLSKNEFFVNNVRNIHNKYGKLIRNEILNYYDILSEKLNNSQKLNFILWPILNQRVSVGAYPLGSWEAEVECDKSFFKVHYNFLDTYFNSESMIEELQSPNLKNQFIYTIGGQRINSNMLSKGVYISGKRKIVR